MGDDLEVIVSCTMILRATRRERAYLQSINLCAPVGDHQAISLTCASIALLGRTLTMACLLGEAGAHG